MAKCDFCGKGVTFGIKVSHSHRRSNKAWKPNVKRVKALSTVLRAMYTSVQGVCAPALSPVRFDSAPPNSRFPVNLGGLSTSLPI